MSLLGDDFNGHHSRFFPTLEPTAGPGPPAPSAPTGQVPTGPKRTGPSKDTIDAHAKPFGRPRKDSMAKASAALNQAYNAAALRGSGATPTAFSFSNTALDQIIAGSGDAIAIASEVEMEGGKESVLKCPLHGGDCDGLTVTNLHVTAQARMRRELTWQPPMLDVLGREMVDWWKMLKDARGEWGE
jgi:hypothetical protein